MKFLRITAADNTRTYIPDNYVVKLSIGADTKSAATAYGTGRITRGKIVGVSYLDGISGSQPSIVVVTGIPVYTTGGILYEYGCFTKDGAFVAVLSNAVLSN